MNYFDHIPLDIKKDPREFIIDKINQVNGLSLTWTDWVFEAPETSPHPVWPDADTKVKYCSHTHIGVLQQLRVLVQTHGLDCRA